MNNIKILSSQLKRQVATQYPITIDSGLNWVIGSGGTGKSTILEILEDLTRLKATRAVVTDLQIRKSEAVLVDFEFCTVSEPSWSELFKMNRETNSSVIGRSLFFKTLIFRLSQGVDYQWLLIDNLFQYFSHEACVEMVAAIRDVADGKCNIVCTAERLIEGMSGNILRL